MATRPVPQQPLLYDQPYRSGHDRPRHDQPYDPYQQPGPSAYDSAAYEPAPVPRANRASAEPLSGTHRAPSESLSGTHRAPSEPLPAGPAPARALIAAPGSANPLPRRIPRRTQSAPAAAPAPAAHPGAQTPRTPSWAAPAEPEQPAYDPPAAGYPQQVQEPYPDQVYRTPYEQPAPRQEHYDGSYDTGSYDNGAFTSGTFTPGGHDSGSYDSGSHPAGGYDNGAYGTDGYDAEAYDTGSRPAAAPYDVDAYRTADPYSPPADQGFRAPGGQGRAPYGGADTPAAGRHIRAAGTGGRARPAGGGTGESGTPGVTPLRRRVRGATLRTTWSDEAPRTEAPRPVTDAEEVRSELDEFEAAIERANRDTRTTRTDEGAQQ